MHMRGISTPPMELAQPVEKNILYFRRSPILVISIVYRLGLARRLKMSNAWRLIVLLPICLYPRMLVAAELPARAILVLEQSDERGPFDADVVAGLRSTINANPTGPLSIYVENLNLDRFGGATYERSLQGHLLVKYEDRPIALIIALGPMGLEYVSRWHAVLWPKAPVVFGLVDEQTASRLANMPNTTGRTLQLSFEDMIRAARSIVPGLGEVAILGDPLDRQPLFKNFAEQKLTKHSGLNVIDLTGMPMNDLLTRVAALPNDAAILYTSIMSDESGTFYAPVDAFGFIAAKANRPIIVAVETFLGRGGTGGFVVMPSRIGEEVARLALDVLNGKSAAGIAVSKSNAMKFVFDSRELQRWNANNALLPKGSEIRFDTPTLWEKYWWQITLVGIVIGVQAALIARILIEHRRRRTAELQARQQILEIAHLNRHATAGELSATITHELFQPLTAILSNAEAAELIVNSPSPDIAEIRNIVADIKRDDRRATGIITRMRDLLKKDTTKTQEIDLNETLAEVFSLLLPQAIACNVLLVTKLSPEGPRVIGDRVQLQQVILNLVANALDALEGVIGGLRQISGYTIQFGDNRVHVCITDTGPGISNAKLCKIFESFYTTKKAGMGMGLSISRKIIESHGGQIRAANRPGGGAEFRFSLPLAPEKRE
jgi:signal transduction histidine kinase